MVDQIGAARRSDDLIGDERPPSRRGGVLLVVGVLVLAGLGAARLLDPPAAPGAAPAAGASSAGLATPAEPPTPVTDAPSALASPATDVVVAPAGSAGPLPWRDLARLRDASIDLAVDDRVRWHGRTYRLTPRDRVLGMARAAGGPVLLVQSRGTTVLEQLRTGSGRARRLAAFYDETRLPQGFAVDPTGRRIAYAVGSAAGPGTYELVVRDLRTAAVEVQAITSRSFAVRDWVTSGVVLEQAVDPGGPPYRWRPGTPGIRRITPPTEDGDGPYLLAAAPVRTEWAVTSGPCTGLVATKGRSAAVRFCDVTLGQPAAWSPDGDHLVARGDQPVLRVLDVRTGENARLSTPPRLFIAQVTWQGTGTVLVAVHTLAGGRGGLLSCGVDVGDDCRRVVVPLPGPLAHLVLAR